ncbi:MAG: hypothetical protein JRE43_07760, partial [Deltaproteobacteria bacterium]|nr:hypothetical protein [Deltaproteobacteria bacterium]
MRCREALLSLICFAISATSQSAEIEVRTLGASGGAAKALCERCADGDFLVRTKKLEVAIGGSHRRDESFYKFPTADALGSILFLRPAGTDLRGDIMVGTPYLRIGNTTRHVRYEHVEVQRSGDYVTFVASAVYSDPQGLRAKFEGRYHFA